MKTAWVDAARLCTVLALFPYTVITYACPSASWHQLDTMCYYVPPVQTDWSTTTASCALIQSGSTLASIHTELENNFITDLLELSGETYAWIGLSRISNETYWTWSDGSEADVFFWGDDNVGNSTGDCVLLEQREDSRDGAWWSTDCTSIFSFVCQFSTLPPTTPFATTPESQTATDVGL